MRGKLRRVGRNFFGLGGCANAAVQHVGLVTEKQLGFEMLKKLGFVMVVAGSVALSPIALAPVAHAQSLSAVQAALSANAGISSAVAAWLGSATTPAEVASIMDSLAGLIAIASESQKGEIGQGIRQAENAFETAGNETLANAINSEVNQIGDATVMIAYLGTPTGGGTGGSALPGGGISTNTPGPGGGGGTTVTE